MNLTEFKNAIKELGCKNVEIHCGISTYAEVKFEYENLDFTLSIYKPKDFELTFYQYFARDFEKLDDVFTNYRKSLDLINNWQQLEMFMNKIKELANEIEDWTLLITKR